MIRGEYLSEQKKANVVSAHKKAMGNLQLQTNLIAANLWENFGKNNLQ